MPGTTMGWKRSRRVALVLGGIAVAAVSLAACGRSGSQERAERAAAQAERVAALAAQDNERVLERVQRMERALEQTNKDRERRERVAALDGQRAPASGPDPVLDRPADRTPRPLPRPTGVPAPGSGPDPALERLGDRTPRPPPHPDGLHPVTPGPNPALRPSGVAILSAGVTDRDMKEAEAAIEKMLQVRNLPKDVGHILRHVRGTLPHPETVQFRNVHMNVAHNGGCGEVDFEYWPDGKRTRSGYRWFVVQIAHYRNSGFDTEEGSGIAFHSGIDIDYQNRRDQYNELSKKVDCTPDLRF